MSSCTDRLCDIDASRTFVNHFKGKKYMMLFMYCMNSPKLRSLPVFCKKVFLKITQNSQENT